MIPKDVLAIYEAFHVPQHIKRHMIMVSALATVIATNLSDEGLPIDVNSLQFAALLHDALKIYTISDYHRDFFQHDVTPEDLKVWNELKVQYGNLPDSQAVYDFLLIRNEPKIALMIKKHDFSSLNKPEMQPYSLEEKVLYYADKRVKHDKIVTIEERIVDGNERYVKSEEQMQKSLLLEKELFQLERELFAKLSLSSIEIDKLAEAEFLKLAGQYL